MSEERFTNAAPLPDRLHRLHELALDLWWSWDLRAREVFRRLDYPLWRATAHNPVRMLQVITAERLAAAAADPTYLRAYDQAIFGLDDARTVVHPWTKEHAAAINGGSNAFRTATTAATSRAPQKPSTDAPGRMYAAARSAKADTTHETSSRPTRSLGA